MYFGTFVTSGASFGQNFFISSKLIRIFVIKRKKQKNRKNSIKELKTIVFPVGGLFKKSKTYFFDLTWIFLNEKKGQLNKKDFLFCELEENIRIGFYKRFGRNINVKHEMVEKIVHNEDDDIEPKSLTFDEIIEGDKERTEWTERSDLWFKTVNP